MKNHRRHLLVLCSLALLTPGPALAQLLWAEGTHYQRVQPLVPPDVPAGRIPVTEVFSYACGGCFQAVKEVERLKTSLPPDAALTYLHAGFSTGWPLFQRAFFTAQALGIAETNHARLFDAIWTTMDFPYVDKATRRLRQPPPTLEDAARFYARGGSVSEADFLKKASSPEVDAAVNRAEELIRTWRVPSTPSFVVGGRYLINSQALKSWTEMSQLINYLVGLERSRLRPASPAP